MKSAYFWPVMGQADEICFHYQPIRRQKHVEQMLGQTVPAGGVLHTDGYSAYARYAKKTGIAHAQCWAHGNSVRHGICIDLSLSFFGKGDMYQHQLDLPEVRLREVGTARDKAHNRAFFFDQYVGLLLLYFFNPTVTSPRGLRQVTDLNTVRQQLGCRAVSLAALSEAAPYSIPTRCGKSWPN